MSNYTTKDSGKREQFSSGFKRDINTGKLRFDLIPIELLKRLAGLYTRGAEKYGDNNWRIAEGEKELNRFKECAWRHFIQFQEGVDDGEDHAIAAIWNIIAYEWLTKHKKEDLYEKGKGYIKEDWSK